MMMVAQTTRPRLQQQFSDEISKKVLEKFEYSNIHELPKLSKIVINVGIGKQ